MSDHADNTAAIAAGWKRTQIDKGSGANPRYGTRYEKPTTGQAGYSGGLLKAEGWSNVDQATADANALAALNDQRKHVYGGSGSSAGTGTAGTARTFDA